MRVYLDACVIISLIEVEPPFHERVKAALNVLCVEESSQLITSRLSMLECRVRAVRSDNQYVLRRYDEFFFAENVLLAEVDAAVIERATRLRAGYAFRTPDAIHLATAIDTSSDVFLTRDNRLLQCKEITVQLVP